MKRTLSGATLCAAVSAGVASAAETAGAPVIRDEVTVTSTRVERPLLSVPTAIGIVDQQDIQLGRQQLGLDESLVRVPGLFMQDRFNFAQDLRVSIRGSGARANFGIRGIKVVVDGIPETLPDGQGGVDSIDLGSAQRIEVIRGPASSLYGNASGGVISVVTEDGPPVPFVEGGAAAGGFGYRKYNAKAGGEQGAFNYLASVSRVELDGFREHSETDIRQANGKFRYAFDADSDLTLLTHVVDSPRADDPGAVNAAAAAATPRLANPTNVRFDAGEALSQQRLGLVYRRALGGGHEVTARNYYVWRDFSNKLPFQGGGIVELDRFFVGGGLMYSHTGAGLGHGNRFTVGVDLDYQDDDRRRFDNLLGLSGPLVFDQREEVSSLGVYVQNELQVTERLGVTIGARYDEVTFDVSDRFQGDGDDGGKQTLDEVSPMLGVLYRVSPAVNLYGNVSTGFETPTTTEFANPSGGGGFNPALSPQTLVQYEVGVKGGLPGRFTYEAAVFQIDVDDELIPRDIPGQPGRSFFVNAGKTTRRGLELGATAYLPAGFTAAVAYTYSDYEFDRFVDENGNVRDGNTVPGTPEHLVFAELGYSHPSGFYGAWDVLYVSDFFADDANTVENDAYTVSNLRLGYRARVGEVEIAPFLGVNNLFDERYNQNVRINAFGGRFFEPGPERNLYGGVTARYDFGG